MAPSTRGTPDVPVDVVVAARAGDAHALDLLVAQSLPLVYNVVGRALDGHPDTDDVVQESVLRVVSSIGTLEREASFRSWMLAITVRQVRDWMRRRRVDRNHLTELAAADRTPDVSTDFVAATIDQLLLDTRRRHVAEATRWLDAQDRDVLSLWWLEASGDLTRPELAQALGVERRHAAVRVQRMRERLATGIALVTALEQTPRCAGLQDAVRRWDGAPSPLWRKRLDRHVRGCSGCAGVSDDAAPERLLAGLPLLVPPGSLAGLLGASSLLPGAGSSAAGPTAEHAHVVPRGRRGAGRLRGAGRAGRSWWPGSHVLVAVVGGVTAVAVGVLVALPLVGGAASPPAAPEVVAQAQAQVSVPAGATAAPADLESGVVRVEPAPATGTGTAPAASGPGVPRPSARPGGPSAPAVAAASGRKGVGVWDFADAAPALDASGADWYYTWGTDPGPGAASDSRFVPMIWGRDSVTDPELARAAEQGPYLLGFNEPDLAGQAEMSVDEALDLWPRLESTGQTLGSPAVAWGGDQAGGWLDRFMQGADDRGYRVDFITLHWYGGDFDADRATAQLRSYVEGVHARYGKPIWLTEFALIDFSSGARPASQEEQAAFLTEATQMLDGLDYVHRYAWFGLPADAGDPKTGLYLPGPVATPAGRAFEAAG